MALKSYWGSFIATLFPSYCISCSEILLQEESFLCLECQFHLPILDHYGYADNAVVKRLRGKIVLAYGMSYLSFSQSSIVQKIIHQLKYQGRRDVGLYFGRLIGQQLLLAITNNPVDVIVPVPLHPRKLKERGYNQSACLATGIAQVLKVSVDTRTLIREQDNASQTNFWGSDRFENVANVFSCHSDIFQDKHILLVDDVLTTGATIAAAANCITKSSNTRVSVALLALA